MRPTFNSIFCFVKFPAQISVSQTFFVFEVPSHFISRIQAFQLPCFPGMCVRDVLYLFLHCSNYVETIDLLAVGALKKASGEFSLCFSIKITELPSCFS